MANLTAIALIKTGCKTGDRPDYKLRPDYNIFILLQDFYARTLARKSTINTA
ncbi:MAG: hypothetical protein ACRC6M_19765 [Microcystaceae cyanobacterium]